MQMHFEIVSTLPHSEMCINHLSFLLTPNIAPRRGAIVLALFTSMLCWLSCHVQWDAAHRHFDTFTASLYHL